MDRKVMFEGDGPFHQEERHAHDIAAPTPTQVHSCSTLLAANQEFATENETPADSIPESIVSDTIFHRGDD
jgi:hypothetical protein